MIRTWLRCFATAAVIVGPLFGLLAIGFALYTFQFTRHAAHTTGTIIALTAKTDKDTGVTYAPTFVFTTPNGVAITKQSGTGSNPPGFSVGEQVPVLFDLDNPPRAEINTTNQLWILPMILGLVSLLFTPTGALLLRRPSIRTAPFLPWTNAKNV